MTPDPSLTVAESVAREKAGERRVVCYLAHPVGAPTVDGVLANLAAARRWLWALRQVSTWSIAAPWMPAVEACIEAGAEESVERERGLADDCAALERCDAIVLVGGRVSAGMALEQAHALAHGLAVVDLTGLGAEPGEGLGEVVALWSALVFDPTIEGETVGGCTLCGEATVSKRGVPAGAWKLATSGRSIDAEGIRLRAEGGDAGRVMARIARLPQLEQALRAIARGEGDAVELARKALESA